MALTDFAIEVVKAALVLFIIVDPFGNIPIFMGLTRKMTDKARQRIFDTAILVGIFLLLTFSFAGQELLLLFGVSIFSFQIAGGILLLIIAVKILVAGRLHEPEEQPPESLGAVPIAIPLLVGPGAITTTMLNLQTYDVYVTLLAVIVVLSATWVILRFINHVYRFLGDIGASVIAQVMSLFIAAIAIQYVITGTTEYLKVIK
jgi:multiple antibiotic resistance protein